MGYSLNFDLGIGVSTPTKNTGHFFINILGKYTPNAFWMSFLVIVLSITVDGGKFASEIAFLCRKSALRDLQGTFKGPARNLQGTFNTHTNHCTCSGFKVCKRYLEGSL